jgi:hypothetical protein
MLSASTNDPATNETPSVMANPMNTLRPQRARIDFRVSLPIIGQCPICFI